MKTTKVILNKNNKLASNPNNFIRMCYKLSNKYELSISSMKGFSNIDRDFEAELIGADIYIKINYKYETDELEYFVDSKNEINNKKIEEYIIEGANKFNFVTGDIVYDEYGNRYEVLKDTDISVSENGCLESSPVLVKDCDGQTIEKTNLILSII